MPAHRLLLAAFQPAPRRPIQDFLHQAALSRTRDPGHGVEAPEEEADIHVLEVVLSRSLDPQESQAGERSARARHSLLAPQVARRLRVDPIQRLSSRPRVRQAPAPLAGAGPEVHQVGRGAHQHRFVLDHDQGVAPSGQLVEDLHQPVRVARVKPHRGLVQHVERVGQARAQGVGELDALGLAAGQGASQPVEREVAEVDALEEPQPGLELGQDRTGDLPLALRELEAAHEPGGLPHGHGVHLGDASARQSHPERLAPQTRPAALPAGQRGLVLLHHEPVADLVGLLLQALEERDRPAEPLAPLHQQAPVSRRKPAPRNVEGNAALARELLEPGPEHLSPRAGPGPQGSLSQGPSRVRNDELRRELQDVAEPAARGTHAERAVEGEQGRLGTHRGLAAMHAFPALAAALGRPLAELELEPTLAAPERLLARLREALPLAGPPGEPVHHHPHLARVAAERRGRIERGDAVAEPEPGEPGTHQLRRLVLPAQALGARQRGQHQEGLALGPSGGLAGDRLRVVGGDEAVAVPAMGPPQAREQESEVIVDLRRRSHRRARAARGRHLLDGHRRHEAGDRVDVGTREPFEELPGVARHRLHVAPLSLGVEGVEGKRRLARSRHAGDDGQTPARELDIEVLEVVLARAAHLDRGGGGDVQSIPRGSLGLMRGRPRGEVPSRQLLWCPTGEARL